MSDINLKEQTRIRLQIVREVSLVADQDEFYNQAEKLGQVAAQKMTSRHRSQITDLENVANTALKVTDVLNHIKNQTARRNYWQDLGPDLLKFVQNDLGKRKKEICSTLSFSPDTRLGQQVHLYLIREFIRQLTAHYEYQAATSDRGS